MYMPNTWYNIFISASVKCLGVTEDLGLLRTMVEDIGNAMLFKAYSAISH